MMNNSKIRTEVTFETQQGRVLSKRKEYYENGTLFREGTYSKGNGSWTWDVAIGKVVSYFEDGQLMSEELFDDQGSHEGETRIYNRKGKLQKRIIYKNDLKVEEFEESNDT